MKNACMIIFAGLVVLGSAEEPLDSSETFTQVYPFAERAFFYYPTGAGNLFNRAGNPAPSVDFDDNPFDAAAATSSQDIPAAYFVPTSDLLSMPYPSRSDQEADEKAAMKHLEMLKELHDKLESSEQKFLKPSLSFGGNGVTLPMNAFVAMLQKLSKTVTKTVITTQFTTVFMNVSNSVSETTDSAIVVSNTDTKATTTTTSPATTIAETTTPTISSASSSVLETTPVIESTPVIEPTSMVETTTSAIETTASVIETSTTTIPVSVTTSTPLVIVTTITTTIL
ncbi:integumentary mucin C.1-like [Daphnia pulex]|jgi:hypothetical protein|uniref:integumentary mucin C.1-like n=1 Tax=Daphnia pulex TaxID=6669 RepID=UPI001EE05470|nr:integumentary mucin C.1-like [Daphnia pulex]XP_046642799.1 integumentary mucin C.1-like [Daphnia pulicaria]